ncbi:DUF4975 domain-containing protein, partial [Klebsiella pneumoniae]|nr:DUF4975 domain-containing protein [Klebsiella pneumoniae]
NNVCAYTQRIYGIQKNCWSINNYGGSITVSNLRVSQQETFSHLIIIVQCSGKMLH